MIPCCLVTAECAAWNGKPFLGRTLSVQIARPMEGGKPRRCMTPSPPPPTHTPCEQAHGVGVYETLALRVLLLCGWHCRRALVSLLKGHTLWQLFVEASLSCVWDSSRRYRHTLTPPSPAPHSDDMHGQRPHIHAHHTRTPIQLHSLIACAERAGLLLGTTITQRPTKLALPSSRTGR